MNVRKLKRKVLIVSDQNQQNSHKTLRRLFSDRHPVAAVNKTSLYERGDERCFQESNNFVATGPRLSKRKRRRRWCCWTCSIRILSSPTSTSFSHSSFSMKRNTSENKLFHVTPLFPPQCIVGSMYKIWRLSPHPRWIIHCPPHHCDGGDVRQ